MLIHRYFRWQYRFWTHPFAVPSEAFGFRCPIEALCSNEIFLVCFSKYRSFQVWRFLRLLFGSDADSKLQLCKQYSKWYHTLNGDWVFSFRSRFTLFKTLRAMFSSWVCIMLANLIMALPQSLEDNLLDAVPLKQFWIRLGLYILAFQNRCC